MLILILVAALVAVIVFVHRQPDNFTLTRSVLIDAPASAIFPHVNNLQHWGAWSPWVKMDPTALYSFRGPIEGIDAATRWQGKKTGEGSMVITKSEPDTHLTLRLDFLKPMQATHFCVFTFMPQDGQTLVTWTMTGPRNFFSKSLHMVMNFDKLVGGQFAQGLNDLKYLSEQK